MVRITASRSVRVEGVPHDETYYFAWRWLPEWEQYPKVPGEVERRHLSWTDRESAATLLSPDMANVVMGIFRSVESAVDGEWVMGVIHDDD